MVKILRNVLDKENQTLRQHFFSGATVTDLVRGRAALVDQLLTQVWMHVWPSSPPLDIALIAVGGYGRGELHPGSDIDLLILLTDDHPALPREGIAQFITLLWDIGLEVGHSVRSLRECAREAAQDITVATNLIEARRLLGPETLFQALQTDVGPESIWPTAEFFEAKRQEQIRRHHKYHDTAYNLEPNVKEGPGGLRDIQMIGWVAKRYFGAGTLSELVSHGFLTPTEYGTLIEGQGFLWRIRFGLHVLAGRREDRLLFDHQRTLAREFGYQDDERRLGVEHFMKRYYRTVMELSCLNEMLLQLFQEAILYKNNPGIPVKINKRFQARGNFIEATYDKVFEHYPFALLEIFLLLASQGELQGVRASTIRLIRNHRHLINDDFRADLRCRSLFMELLRQPQGVSHELHRMNRYGVLGAYLPVFGHIVGQMQHDLFHVYTVDEHTLLLVRNLRRFAAPEFAHEFPLCSKTFQRLPKAEMLYLGGLFHDIAKGRGGDHSELGAEDAIAFCLHHGLSQYDARLVSWLVKNHLVMSSTAQRQDISDPEVVNGFATLVGDQVHLDYLYLLTIADIRATNPNLWNSWRGALLAELYLTTTRALRRGLKNPIDQTERIEETQTEARAILQRRSVNEAAINALWDDLDDDYFLRHSVDEIAWQAEAVLGSMASSGLPLVQIRQYTPRGGTEIFIYSHDQHDLFAATATALACLGLNVVDARIITTKSGYTLDTYIVLEETGEPIDSAQRMEEISSALRQRLLRQDTGQVSRRARRALKHFPIPTQVSFRLDESKPRTVVEVITADRPGLLSAVGKAFVKCNVRLQNAKITTFGASAEDIFFVTDKDNQPLSGERQFACLQENIIAYLDKLI